MTDRLDAIKAALKHYDETGFHLMDFSVSAGMRWLVAEVQRLDAMRCETCKHRIVNSAGDDNCQINFDDMGFWKSCKEMGGGCRAWENGRREIR